jgi:Multicopper oxidase
MLKPQKTSTRSWTWIRACLAIALIVSASPLVADSDRDRDQGVVRKCGGLTEARSDGSAFPLPVVRESRGGILRTTLHACISTKEMLDENAQPPEVVEFHPPTFEGTIPGPTYVVKPGDELSILLVNDLPANPANERDKAFPHDENSINLHTHGLTVSPLGISDNVFREMNPGTTHLIDIDIPKDHPSGTYWYHVHKHGSVTYQFLGGMAGFLIVKGVRERLIRCPRLRPRKTSPWHFRSSGQATTAKSFSSMRRRDSSGPIPSPI